MNFTRRLRPLVSIVALSAIIVAASDGAEGNGYVPDHRSFHQLISRHANVPRFQRKPFDPRILPKKSLSALPLVVTSAIHNLSSTNSSVSEEWLSRYDTKSTSSTAYAFGIGADSLSNIYVGEYGDVSAFVIIKYSPMGTKMWESAYNGPDGISNAFYVSPSDFFVDRAGNVFIASNLDFDFPESHEILTVKFNSSGMKQWDVRYAPPVSMFPEQPFLTADRTGYCSVIVHMADQNGVGKSVLVNYSPSGTQQWTSQMSPESENGDLFLNAVTVDDSGNIYVTGGVYNSFVPGDLFTAKYNSGGNQLWEVTYNSPADNFEFGGDIASDNAGNVYVTGISYPASCCLPPSDITMKYNSAGLVQWTASYGGAIALDHAGNVVTSRELLTKLNGTTGDTIWTRPYTGFYPAIDLSNNLYIVGSSYTDSTSNDFQVRKVSSGGTLNWTRTYHAGDDYSVGLVLNPTGDVYVLGQTYYANPSHSEIVTINYSTFGDSLWGLHYTNASTYSIQDKPTAIAIDGSGNIYVTGSHGRYSNLGYTTIKYNPHGDTSWVRYYDYEYYPGSKSNEATALAVDSSGNAYVTGYSNGNILTIKYNAIGDSMWTRRHVGPYNGDYPTSVAIDQSGNVIVTGYSRMGYYYDTKYYFVTIKYNPTGDTLWTRFFGEGTTYNYPTALSIDANDNVYVTGYSYPYYYGGLDSSNYVIIKYSSAGDQLWTRTYDGSGHADDGAMDIVVDKKGNVCVTGYSKGAGTYYDYATIMYDSGGVQKWITRFDGTESGDDVASALKIDNDGNVYVTGRSDVATSLADYATVKYDSSGNQKWVAYYNGPANYYDEARQIALDDVGNIYVSGVSYGVGTALDYATVMYAPSGLEQWSVRHTGSGQFDDIVAALAVDKSGDVFVTGAENGSAQPYYFNSDIATIKYSGSSEVNSFVESKWNIVSVPVQPMNRAKNSVFPTAISNAFAFIGNYVVKESLDVGAGYWVKFDSSESIVHRGQTVMVDTISLNAGGWHLIGSISQSLATNNVVVSPAEVVTSDYFGYQGGYYATDSIRPGKGYWVKVNQACNLILSASGLYAATTPRDARVNSLREFNVLRVEDALGSAQQLYFGHVNAEAQGRVSYEMPPPPPIGVFDARFGENKLAIDYPSKIDEPLGFPLIIRSATFPLTVSWQMREGNSSRYELYDVVSGKILASLRHSTGSVRIEKVGSLGIGLRVLTGIQPPSRYALKQNYPNPFNPSTTIRYDLPKDSKVSLKIYDVLGQEVTTLVEEIQDAGYKSVRWDATNMASGIYLYRMVAVGHDGSRFASASKMIIMK